MARKKVLAFFSVLLLVAGALFLLRTFSLESITGASIVDVSKVQISEVRALQEGNILSVSFVIASMQSEAWIAYVLDAGGESVRSGNFSIILEPGTQKRHAFRIQVPEKAENELFITISFSDGETFTYRRVAVTKGSSERNDEISRARSFAPVTGLVAVLVLVILYLVHVGKKIKRTHTLAHHARKNLTFCSPR